MKLCFVCSAPCVDDDWKCSTCGTTPNRDSGFRELAPQLALENNGFRSEYFEQLIDIENATFWFPARNRLISLVAAPFMKSGVSFCEVGCGTGYVLAGLSRCFPSVNFSATDIYSSALKFAASRVPAAQFYQMDARSIPFSAEFDVMGLFDVLEHIEEDEAILKELHRALKPKGILLVTVPQHPSLWSQQDEFACHVRRYTRKEIHSKLRQTGFREVFTTSFVSLLFPAMYLSRRLNKEQRRYDARLQFNRPLNALMNAVMAIEFRLIRLGIRFPFGGSLLVAAQKID